MNTLDKILPYIQMMKGLADIQGQTAQTQATPFMLQSDRMKAEADVQGAGARSRVYESEAALNEAELANRAGGQGMEGAGGGQKKLDYFTNLWKFMNSVPGGQQILQENGFDLKGFQTMSPEQKAQLKIKAFMNPNDPEVQAAAVNDPEVRAWVQGQKR